MHLDGCIQQLGFKSCNSCVEDDDYSEPNNHPISNTSIEDDDYEDLPF